MVRFSVIAGLLICLASGTIGCNGSSDLKTAKDLKKAAPLADHDHSEKGPHGGGIIELGKDEYHGEIVVDHGSHSIAVYVLGKDAKTPEPLSATEITVTPEGKEALTLKAAAQKDDPEGKASKFELVNEDTVHEITEAGFLHGKLRITIGDNPYVGDIDYHLEGSEHDHDHEEKKPAESK